jgi:DNA-binding MarR family transcriptional regulator
MTEPDLGRLFLEAHRVLAAEFTEAMEERGLTGIRAGHAAVFLHIERRSGTRLTELARRARISKQGMMLVVDELENRGFVNRASDPRDARAKVVKLTARGRTAATECRRAVQALETRTRRSLGERRYDGLRDALTDLIGEDPG